MKIHFTLAMALANIAFAVAGTSTGDMSITTFMEQNIDLPVNGSARIIGGWSVSISKVPHQCSLRRDDSHTCGCSILNKDFILTAAHCVTSDPTPYSVVVGTSTLLSGGSNHMVKTVKIHPTYSFPNDDIAVLELQMSINMSLPNRKAVILPSPFKELRHLQNVGVTGWGIIRDGAKWLPNKLQGVNLKHIARRQCLKLWNNEYITTKMICAKRTNKGTCKGDSGGALLAKSGNALVQYGIVSFGSSAGCTALPGVFTRVSAYISWIKEVSVLSDC